jgi:Transposase
MTNSSVSETTPEVAAWIGLDWADQQQVLSVHAADSTEVEHYGIELAQLPEWISQLQARWPGRTVALALEQARGAVLHAVMRFDFLRLYPINPKALARYRESFYPSGSKGDPSDADLLREMIQHHAERLAAGYARDPPTATVGGIPAPECGRADPADQPDDQSVEKLLPGGAGVCRRARYPAGLRLSATLAHPGRFAKNDPGPAAPVLSAPRLPT